MTSPGFVVLVVEDDVFTLIDVAGAFEESGWTVLEAGSGQAALELCNSDTQVDALITDIDLGNGTTGWDVAQAFWRRDALPVVYTSGDADTPHLRVPHSRFVAKPCPPSVLVDACAHLPERYPREETGRWPSSPAATAPDRPHSRAIVPFADRRD